MRWNLIAELDVSNAVIRNFVWGQDISGTLHGVGGIGGLLIIGGTNAHYCAHDGNGNITNSISHATGRLSASYEYDPFGKILQSSGEYASENPFKFSTKYTDQETGLVYYGFRYYNAEVGRWTSEDPLEEQGGFNLYALIENDALNGVDYLGLDEFKIVIKSYIAKVGNNYGEFPGFGPNKH